MQKECVIIAIMHTEEIKKQQHVNTKIGKCTQNNCATVAISSTKNNET